MKRILFSFVIILLTLSACGTKEIKVYSDEEIDEFNSILENVGNGKTKAYDLREYEECYAGRVSGFYCSQVEQIKDETAAMNRVVENLVLILGDKKNTMIILMDSDGSNSEFVSLKLFEKGYKNIHYFKSGYEKYVSFQDNFVPETGECDC